MECKRCLLTDEIPGITINYSGQCNFCDLHDNLESHSKKINISDVIKEIKNKGKGRKYDCVIGISGGFDSSFLLHIITNIYNLRTLALHFDNGWNGKESEHNIKVMVSGTGVDYLSFSINNSQLNKLNLAFLKAGVSDADIPNDMAMSKIMFDVADKYDIKTIINGHNYRYEGSTPLAWSYMDAKYVKSVAKYYNINISSYPILTFWDQLKYMKKGIKSIRLLYYISHNKEAEKKLLNQKYGWKDYGDNHGENVYTEFIGNYLLPRKFNINKKIIYRSAELRSGIITRDEAKNGLGLSDFDARKLRRIENELGVTIDEIMKYPINDRKIFKSYHQDFKRWKFLIFLGAKFGYFPMTFYTKYCK